MTGVSLLPAWQRNDEGIAADAVAFWRRLGVLPRHLDLGERARELCVVAYLDGALIGVSTVVPEVLPHLRCRFGFFRCLVAPDHRRGNVARRLTVESLRLLERWSKENPRERMMGMAVILENRKLDIAKLPVWPETRLGLVGYTPHGEQIRVAWFEHARLDRVP